MKLEFPRITRPLKLANYDPAFLEQEISVWVNQPIGRLNQFSGFAREQEAAKRVIEAAGDQAEPGSIKEAVESLARVGSDLIDWLAETWSQGPEDTHWTRQDIEDLANECMEHDNGLYAWLVRETWDIVTSYRLQIKKN